MSTVLMHVKCICSYNNSIVVICCTVYVVCIYGLCGGDYWLTICGIYMPVYYIVMDMNND